MHKYQNSVEAEQLVIIDKTWARTDMAPLRGSALRGHNSPSRFPRPLEDHDFPGDIAPCRIGAPRFINYEM